MKKNKVVKLSCSNEINYFILGISSSESDYKFIWGLNKELGTNFIKQKDIEIYNQKIKSEEKFSNYCYEDELNMLNYSLIINKNKGSIFIPEIKAIDFVILVKGEITENYKLNFIQKLKSIHSINGVFLIDPSKLKSKNILLVD